MSLKTMPKLQWASHLCLVIILRLSQLLQFHLHCTSFSASPKKQARRQHHRPRLRLVKHTKTFQERRCLPKLSIFQIVLSDWAVVDCCCCSMESTVRWSRPNQT